MTAHTAIASSRPVGRSRGLKLLKEFKDDLLVLEEMWAERSDAEKSYLSLRRNI